MQLEMLMDYDGNLETKSGGKHDTGAVVSVQGFVPGVLNDPRLPCCTLALHMRRYHVRVEPSTANVIYYNR